MILTKDEKHMIRELISERFLISSNILKARVSLDPDGYKKVHKDKEICRSLMHKFINKECGYGD